MAVEGKFVVLKHEDIDKYLSDAELNQFVDLVEKIDEGRANDGKDYNFYAVINTDEPYFPQVKEIMKSNGHWEE